MWDEYKLQRRLRDKVGAINGWLSIPCGFSAEVMAHQNWDSLTVDMQHGLIGYADATAMLAAISTTETTPLVRVPWLEEGIVMKMLDAGAHGIICPMVNTPDDAARLVSASRYPTLGARSFGPIRASLSGGDDYHKRANDDVLVIAMIETKQALGNVDAILSTPGISGAYIGPADLACSLGCEISFAPTAKPVVNAIAQILAAAKKHGVVAGVHTGSAAYARAMLDKGFDLATIMSDARLMAAGAEAVLAEAHGNNADKNAEGY